MQEVPPLKGVRVLELGHIVAAPFAGMILHDLGSEVIKVEKPGGEIARDLPDQGPSIFYALNRGKKSVVINLKDERGREAYLRLASKVDIIVENMGPGVVEKLGIGYDDVVKYNDKVIYVSIKGFGKGIHEKRPALDVVAQALSGLMRVTGHPGGEPVRVGTSIADMLAGLYGVLQAILALYRDNRPTFIEAPLYDSLVSIMAYWVTYVQVIGREPEPIGSGHAVWAPYRAFKARDGWVFIGVTSDKHWARFCQALGFDDLLADERFKTNQGRARHKKELESIIQARLQGLERDYIVEKLTQAGVPVAPIRNVGEVARDEYLVERGILRKGLGLRGEELLYITSPLLTRGFTVNPPGRPPHPGEHTVEVLSSLGYSMGEIEALARKGVVYIHGQG
ncbi:MAG: CoA transferase [Desulfurococcales archaeon]|nr:CoA transferase [Desulfurococcales archaeon]